MIAEHHAHQPGCEFRCAYENKHLAALHVFAYQRMCFRVLVNLDVAQGKLVIAKTCKYRSAVIYKLFLK